MEIQNKVLVLPNICGLEIDLSAEATPTLNPSLQSFYNTYTQNGEASTAYTTPSKISFRESATYTRSGMVYKQEVRLEFPSNDPLRSNRITEYLKVKYLYLKLSTGLVMFFGRNDYYQNTEPKTTMSSNETTTQVIYQTESIFPIGFTNGSFSFELSEEIPLNFFNLNL